MARSGGSTVVEALELDGSWGVTARALRGVAVAVRLAGADPDAVLLAAGLDATLPHDNDARVAHETFYRVLRAAAESTRDRWLGLRLANVFDARMFEVARDVTEYLVLQAFAHSSTLGDGLRRWMRYYPIADDRVRWSIELGVSKAFVRLDLPTAAPPLYAEMLVSSLARLILATAGSNGTVVEATFRHAKTVDEEAERLMGATVRFDAQRTGLVIRTAALDAPLRTARAPLLVLVERRADATLDALKQGHGLVGRVRAIIEAKLAEGDATAEGVASAIDVSVRTLSRRLAEAGTSHRALLDEVRSTLARRHVGKRSARDLAALLGFSDTSTYRRAFRRWFGCTPRELAERGRNRHAS